MDKRYVKIKDFPLKQYNTMGLHAFADRVFFPLDVKGIEELFADSLLEESIILGRGSNVILSRDRYDNSFVLTDFLNNLVFQDHYIVAECGVSLSQLSWFALSQSVSGFEFLEDIPGSVGGGLYMNAGTYDNSIGELVHSVTIFDYNKKQTVILKKDELSSSWKKRDSFFQHHPCFIVQCVFDAEKTADYESILSVMLESKKKRFLKQPRNYPNAGSVFKRPYVNGEPQYIWQLINDAGLRGYRIGDAQVSEKHPGFIINRGNATGEDVINLMNHCKIEIKKKYGICIEEEWKIV